MEEQNEKNFHGTKIMPGVHIGRYFNYVDKYYENENVVHNIEPEKLKESLVRFVLPFVKIDKHMFALIKGLMHNCYVAEGDFKGAKILLEQIFPDGLPRNVNVTELARCNALSMSKDIDEWDENDQPIGSTYPEYKTIADMTARCLPVLRRRD